MYYKNLQIFYNSTYITSLFILLVILCGASQAAMQQPLSTSGMMPILPVLGTIEWITEELPFVCKGPKGGINGMGMIAYNGQIYIFGGHVPQGNNNDCNLATIPQADTVSKSAWLYDPAAKIWQQLPDMPQRREYIFTTAGQKAIYVLGGASIESDLYTPNSDCFILQVSGEDYKWINYHSSSVPRTHASGGLIDGQLIFAGGNRYDEKAGGYDFSTIQNCVESLDIKVPNRHWLKRSPIPGYGRGWAASSVYQKHLYLFGGITFLEGGKPKRLKEVLRYDPDKDLWGRLKNMPMAISGWQADTFKGKYILCAGGVIENEKDGSLIWNDTVFGYDIKQDKWYKFNNALPPGGVFNNNGLCVINDQIFIAGAEGPKTTGPKGDRYNYFLIGRIDLKK